jgi:hypothetical protein
MLYEYEMMEKYNVFDRENFIIFWDDLGGKMTRSFDKITRSMKRKYSVRPGDCYLLELSGWIGEHEFKHQIGIVIKT